MKTKFRIVALAGLKGSGKSTVAKLFELNGYHRMAFADPVKKAVHGVAGIEDPILIDLTPKEALGTVLGYSSLRKAYQTLGTEWGRDTIDEGIWVKKINSRLLYISSYLSTLRAANVEVPEVVNIVIDDLRFPDTELEWLQSIGATVVFVDGRDSFKDNHRSETGIARIRKASDYFISNTKELSFHTLVATLAFDIDVIHESPPKFSYF